MAVLFSFFNDKIIILKADNEWSLLILEVSMFQDIFIRRKNTDKLTHDDFR